MPQHLTSMKLSRDEAEDTVLSVDEAPRFPWGLSITLDEESLSKLGIDLSNFEIGQTIEIVAVAKVESKSEHEHQDDDAHQSVGLQITELDIPGLTRGDSAAELIFDRG